MHRYTSKLVKVLVLLIATLMICSQMFESVTYARGSSKPSSHVSSSITTSSSRTTSSSKYTPSSAAKSGSFSSTPKTSSSSAAKSGSFSASPKSSSTVGTSTTKPSSSPKTSSSIVNHNSSTIIVNNHTYAAHYSTPFFFMQRSYYVDDYGATHYMAYRPNFGGIFIILIVVLGIYIFIRVRR